MSQLINLGLGACSMIFLLAALVMDFFDQHHSSLSMRAIYILGIMVDLGHLHRGAVETFQGGPLYFWGALTALLCLRKAVQLWVSQHELTDTAPHIRRAAHFQKHPVA
jgi:hypothetical protein